MAALDPIKEAIPTLLKEVNEIIAKVDELASRETVDPAEVAAIADQLRNAAAALNEKTPEA